MPAISHHFLQDQKTLGSKNKTDFQNRGIRALEGQLYLRRNAFNHLQKIQFSKTKLCKYLDRFRVLFSQLLSLGQLLIFCCTAFNYYFHVHELRGKENTESNACLTKFLWNKFKVLMNEIHTFKLCLCF